MLLQQLPAAAAFSSLLFANNPHVQVMHLRLMMPASERKRAPEMADGDGWLDILREKLREEREVFDGDSQQVLYWYTNILVH